MSMVNEIIVPESILDKIKENEIEESKRSTRPTGLLIGQYDD